LKDHPEAHFHAGIVRTKLRDYAGALKAFEACRALDERNFEAARNADRVRAVLKQEHRQARGGTYGAWFLGVIAILQLIALWIFYFLGKVTEPTVAVLVSVLVGL